MMLAALPRYGVSHRQQEGVFLERRELCQTGSGMARSQQFVTG